MVPVGVGNNSTPINVSLLQRSSDTTGIGDSDISHLRESSKDFDTQSEPWTEGPPWGDPEGEGDDEGAGHIDAEGDIDDEHGSEDGGDGDDARLGSKRKGKGKEGEVNSRQKKRGKVDEKKPMGPRPGKSTPAPTQNKTSRTAIDKFSDIAAKEEETTQKVIELKRTKLKAHSDKEIAKVKSKAEVKMNQDRLRAHLAEKQMELEMKKMEYEYRFKLATQTATQPRGPSPRAQTPGLPSLPQFPGLPNETHAHAFEGQSTNFHLPNSFSSGGHWNEMVAGSSSTTSSTEPTFTEQLQDNSTDFNLSY